MSNNANDKDACAALHQGMTTTVSHMHLIVNGQSVSNAFGFTLSFVSDGRGGSFPVLYWQGGRVTTPWSLSLDHQAVPHEGSSGVAPWKGQSPQRHICPVMLRRLVEQWRATGKSLVVANGCFDVFHAGHARLLNEAKRQGDVLIVLINSDASIRRLKGTHRPICRLEDRVAVLESLGAVDAIVDFDSDTPIPLIEIIRPDVLVKGDEYDLPEIPGADLAQRVHRVPMQPGLSSTGIARKWIVGSG